eukprot:GFYU01001673.1.p1 GENE.GFYU01001673.1~~GFYU01001673.1.p1  ORF type:complete len:335 (+),score=94.02 GFYU01001673.1:57-1007(+)
MAPKEDIVLITGANSGVGCEAARIIAARMPNVKKIYMACRNEAKAKEAIATLVQQTGQSESFFRIVIVDTDNLDTCGTAVVDQLDKGDKLDALLLNAGGLTGGGDAITKEGVTKMFGVNVLGHVKLVETLIAEGAVNKGARIVFSGSEAARGIRGQPKPEFADPNSVGAAIDKRGAAKYTKKGTFDFMAYYGVVKAVGALYMSAMARKEPAYKWITVSPGMTPYTNVMRDTGIMKSFVVCLRPMLRCCSVAHSLEDGGQRYVDGLFDESLSKTNGVFWASKAPIMIGPLYDQSQFYSIFGDAKYQDAAYDAIHKHL